MQQRVRVPHHRGALVETFGKIEPTLREQGLQRAFTTGDHIEGKLTAMADVGEQLAVVGESELGLIPQGVEARIPQAPGLSEPVSGLQELTCRDKPHQPAPEQRLELGLYANGFSDRLEVAAALNPGSSARRSAEVVCACAICSRSRHFAG